MSLKIYKAFFASILISATSNLPADVPQAFSALYTLSLNDIFEGYCITNFTEKTSDSFEFSAQVDYSVNLPNFNNQAVQSFPQKAVISNLVSWNNQQIIPAQLSIKPSTMLPLPGMKVIFDWPQKTAESQYGPKKWAIPLQANTHDLISHQIALKQLLPNSEKTRLEFNIVRKGKIKQYRYQQLGEHTIQTGLGKITTLLLELKRSKGKKVTRFWYAPELDFTLAKAEHYHQNQLIAALNIQAYQRNSGQLNTRYQQLIAAQKPTPIQLDTLLNHFLSKK